ncbi:MAG: ribosome-associated translation inhibitor RaiA [Clostridiaceae bacterium]
MKVSVFYKDGKSTEALDKMVNDKLSKLDRFFRTEVEAKATLSVVGRDHRIEVLIPFNGLMLRGDEKSDDMYKSIDRVVEKLERQLRKYKTRIEKRHTKESVRFPEFNNEAFHKEDDVAMDFEPKIVKSKKFSIKPMTEEEAILQMELLGHNFFVFETIDGMTSVIYKRKDGNYGIIEKETGMDKDEM